MDYTDLSRVKAALGAEEPTDDDILTTCIAAASRAIDRRCAGAIAGDNYFELASVTDEQIKGQVDRQGRIVCWPRKPLVVSVSALSARRWPMQTWSDIDLNTLEIDGGRVVAWVFNFERGPVQVKLSYSGGLAADVDDLPADLVEAGTVLAVRFYREAKTGLTDSIGVAELGTLLYTKALPLRVIEMLRHFKRTVPW